MSRYFIEVSYRGTHYSGFQVQDNAGTIQSEIAKAFETLHRRSVELTGSSRTDSGVHALQNYFHFDDEQVHEQFVYKMNAILPKDIAIRRIHLMHEGAHSRFDAVGREYIYRLHRFKSPFYQDTSYYFPYRIDLDQMNRAAAMVLEQSNFFAFAKTNTQVRNFNCAVSRSRWIVKGQHLLYQVEANRFLRGMVRLLTATLLKVGRGQLSLEEFESLFSGQSKCGYSVPAHGLFLKRVRYRENYFPAPGLHFTGF